MRCSSRDIWDKVRWDGGRRAGDISSDQASTESWSPFAQWHSPSHETARRCTSLRCNSSASRLISWGQHTNVIFRKAYALLEGYIADRPVHNHLFIADALDAFTIFNRYHLYHLRFSVSPRKQGFSSLQNGTFDERPWMTPHQHHYYRLLLRTASIISTQLLPVSQRASMTFCHRGDFSRRYAH